VLQRRHIINYFVNSVFALINRFVFSVFQNYYFIAMSDKPKAKKRKTPKGQDEKASKMKKKIFAQQTQDLAILLLRTKRDVNFYKSKDLKCLRDWHQYAVANPEQFPMAPCDSAVYDSQEPAQEIMNSGTRLPRLSDNFISKLVDRTHENDGSSEPVVRVLSCSIDFERSGYTENHQKVRRVRLTILDGSGQTMLAIPVSNLYQDVKRQLTEGQSIIRIKQYTVTIYKDSEEEGPRPGVAINKYQFLARPAIDVDPTKYKEAICDDQTSATGCKQPVVSPESIVELNLPSTTFHNKIANFQKRSDVEPLPGPVKYCQRGDRLCSKYGLDFRHCLAEQYEDQIENQGFLESISEQCYFVTEEV
jgi:hypothetical protein